MNIAQRGAVPAHPCNSAARKLTYPYKSRYLYIAYSTAFRISHFLSPISSVNINNSISNNLFTKSNFKKFFSYTTFFHCFSPLSALLMKGDDKKGRPEAQGALMSLIILAAYCLFSA